MITKEARDAYNATSKAAAAICNEAHKAAFQAYDREMQPIKEAMRKAYKPGSTVERKECEALLAAWWKTFRRHEIRVEKADKRFDEVMKKAWEECYGGKQTTPATPVQQTLF